MSRDIQDLSYWAFCVCVCARLVSKFSNTHKPEKIMREIVLIMMLSSWFISELDQFPREQMRRVSVAFLLLIYWNICHFSGM